MQKLLTLICFLVFANIHGQCQNNILERVQNYPQFKSINDLSYRILNDFDKKEDRVQAVYAWVATNIAYDIDYYYSLRTEELIFYRTEEERRIALEKVEKELINNTFKNKKGLCHGYASLFTAICNKLNIPSEIVYGYSKLDKDLINTNPGFKDHSWNAVYFDQAWHILDVTWAAGYQVAGERKWVFSFNEDFFDQNPHQFIMHHFPKDERWQLIEEPISKEAFFSKPIYYPSYFESNILLSENERGSLIKQQADKYIYLVFDKLPPNRVNIQAMTRTSIRPERIRFKKNEDGTFTAKIKVKSDPDFLTIFYNNNAILDFKIITEYE